MSSFLDPSLAGSCHCLSLSGLTWHLAACSSRHGTSLSCISQPNFMTRQIHFIFNTKHLHIRRVSRGWLLSVVGGLMVIEGVITAAWVLADTPLTTLSVRL